MNGSRHIIDDELSLEMLTPLDAQAIYDLVDHNREHLRTYLPFVDGTKSVDDTRAFVRGALEDLGDLKQFQYKMLFRGRMVGLIGVMGRYSGTDIYHVGYWIEEASTGKGVVTRAAATLVRFCFETLGARKVEILCASTNTASQGVARRLEFELEGTIRLAEKLNSGLADLQIWGKMAPKA